MRKHHSLPLAMLLGAGFFFLPSMARWLVAILLSVPLTILFLRAYSLSIFHATLLVLTDIRDELSGYWLALRYTVMYHSIRRNHDRDNELGRIPKHDWEG